MKNTWHDQPHKGKFILAPRVEVLVCECLCLLLWAFGEMFFISGLKKTDHRTCGK